MNKNLTVQEALEKLLAEKKSLLNDSNALMTALQEHVAPAYSMQLAFFRNALVDANVGEVLMLADGLGKDAHDRAETEALALLKKNNMPEERAEFVVQTLAKAMGWDQEPPPTKTAIDYYNGGLIALREGKYDKALEDFSKAIEMKPELTDAYNKRGSIYAKMGQYEKAILDYSEVTKQDLKNAFAYYERGMCYYGLEKYKNALDDINEAAQLNPHDKNIIRMQSLLRQKLADDEGDKKDGKTVNKTAVDYYNDGFEALSQKKYDKALSNFNKAIELDPKYVVAYFKRGLTYHSKGNYDAAIADYTKAIELNPKYSKAYGSRGLTYFNKKDYDQAIVNFTKVIELNLNDADAYNSRGLAYLKKEDYNRAIVDFKKTLEINPNHESAKKNLQTALQKIKEPPPLVWQENGFRDMFFKFSGRLNRKRYIIRALPIWVISTIMNVVLSEPELSEDFTPGFYLVIIFLAVAMGISHLSLLTRRWRDLDMSPWWALIMFVPIVNILTLAYFILYKKGTVGPNKHGPDPLGTTYNTNTNPDFDQNKVIKKPKKIVAWIVAGVILISLGIAASIYNDRNLARKHNDSGLVYQKKEQYDKALEEFDQSIKLYPGYAEAYYNRGEVYYEKGEYDKALTDFDEAMELDLTYTKIIKSNKDYVEAYFDRGEDYYEKEEYDKALVYLDRALELNPQYTEAYYTRAQIYNEKNEYDKAITDLNKAIEIDSSHAHIYSERGLIYFKKRDFDRAIDDFKQAIRLSPEYAFAYFNCGKAYYEKKEYDKAITDFDRAIEIDSFWETIIDQYPNCENAYYKRGEEYMNAENYDRAIADFTKVIKINSNNADAHFYRGLVYEDGKGNHNQAIDDYNKVIELQPNNAAAYNNRGVSYGRKGNKDQAISDYMKAIELDPNEELYRNNLQNAL